MDLECSDGKPLSMDVVQWEFQQAVVIYMVIYYLVNGLILQQFLNNGEYTMVVRTNWDQDPDAIGNVELTYENNWMQTCIRVITLEDGSKSYVLATDLDGDGIENINDPDVDGDEIMNNDDDDIDGDLILNGFDETPYGLSECLSYTDCNGEEFGNAQLDCNGICGGESTTGDLNMDGFIDVFDGQEYINQILNDDINATTCNDLDSDNEITVSDIGLLVNCINNSESNFRDNQSEPCQYGMEITQMTQFILIFLT